MTSAYLIEKDRKICDSVFLYFAYRKENVKFQFPPTIVTDTRRVNWTIDDLPGKDPMSVYASSSPRELTLKIEYIVEDPSFEMDAEKWTIGKIKHQINIMKGYFTGTTTEDGGGFIANGTMIVRFKHTLITGLDVRTVRISNVSVAYEGPHIGDGGKSYPLKSIVNIDIATVSAAESDTIYWDDISAPATFDELWY